ncbi:uncharacterized protein LOC113296574 [Papaver somniferum]|uniref:uncharacterized protein LOC113296574 n=1 Tax=Papaver somniferum TaxID=3469 RepID=UPI000E703E93|nr:uncharacterized protein LOC113296574 [Papaver somniferum]
MEIFSRLLIKGEEEASIHGVKITPKNCPISHLFIADNCLLFIRADLKECHNIRKLIETFSTASGQMINFEKSGFFFSKKVQPKHQRMICKILKIKKIDPKDTYLGTPLFISRAKIQLFDSIVEKMEQKIQRWIGKTLSQASKMVLNKATLASVASYQMSCFILPKVTTKKIASLQRDFWWGKESKYKGYYPISYSCLCKPRSKGGLGFRNAQKFNLAMKAKLAWRLLTEPFMLWVSQLKPRYFRKTSAFKAKIPTTSSWIWKCISKGIILIEQNSIWEIGDGYSTNIWDHKCIPDLEEHLRNYKTNTNSHLTLVKDIFALFTMKWNYNLLTEMFPVNIANKINKIRIIRGKPDTLTWLLTKTGKFTVKSIYLEFWYKDHPLLNQVNNGKSLTPNWKPPSKSQLKLNIDAAWISANLPAGLSLILRSDAGTIEQCRAGAFTASTPEEAEALGLLEGAKWAAENGLTNFSIEGDCKNLFDYLNGIESSLEWQNISVLDQVIHTLKSCNNFLGFYFVPRSANNVADIMAKEARSFSSTCNWRKEASVY